MRYVVTVNYRRFKFTDGKKALEYAEMTKASFEPTQFDEDIEVSVGLEEDKEDEHTEKEC